MAFVCRTGLPHRREGLRRGPRVARIEPYVADLHLDDITRCSLILAAEVEGRIEDLNEL